MEGRTLGDDWEKRLRHYDKLKEKAGIDPTVYYKKDLARIRRELIDEYSPDIMKDKAPDYPIRTKYNEELQAFIDAEREKKRDRSYDPEQEIRQ